MNNHEHSTVTDADQIRAELEDRLLEQNLDELLGGVSPNPEERTVAPAPVSATEADPAIAAQQSSNRRGSWLKPVVMLATCAAIAVVLFSGILETNQDSSQLAMSFEAERAEELDASHSLQDDVQYFSTVPQEQLARQSETYKLARQNEAEAMREIRGIVSSANDETPNRAQDGQSYDYSTVGNTPIPINDSNNRLFDQKPDPNQSQTIVGGTLITGEAVAPQEEAFRSNVTRSKTPSQTSALPGITPLASSLGTRYGVNNGQPNPSSTPVAEPELWKLRVLSGRQVTNNQFNRNEAGKDLTVRGMAIAGIESKYQPLPPESFDDGIALEGVGPGNRGDNYERIIENDFLGVGDSPLSTFSIDVDTASYSNMRRMLTQNSMLPPPDAVRIEELVNYFNYDYAAPEGEHPFSVNVETASCPWRPENRLVRIALKGKEIPFEERPASNLVFLLDVSGSMKPANKLPLLKSCFKMMVDYLTENDSISIVVYASGTRMVLPPTTGDQKAVIMESLDQLQAGGSTNGAGGIQLAYQTATENFIPGGINRVILATDGDFNVGITSRGDLHRLIEEKAKSNVFLTTLGFGFGNLQDNTIELLADKGNGNYAYIDSLAEGRKVLIDEMGSTLNTIAKNVKIQVEFNPLEVAASRLIGYENRIMPHEHFNDDTKDAGEIGAGHTVTAFYEIIPATQEQQLIESSIDDLEFQRPQKPSKFAREGHLMLVKLRYLPPDAVIGDPHEEPSKLLRVPVLDSEHEFSQASRDFQFAASVASFGMLLRNSKYAGQASYKNVLEQAQATLGETPESYRVEFVELVKLADRLAGRE